MSSVIRARAYRPRRGRFVYVGLEAVALEAKSTARTMRRCAALLDEKGLATELRRLAKLGKPVGAGGEEARAEDDAFLTGKVEGLFDARDALLATARELDDQ